MDFLDILVQEAIARVENRYYDIEQAVRRKEKRLKTALLESEYTPVIAEIKLASPSQGKIREDIDLEGFVKSAEEIGVAAFSVITIPERFGGSLTRLMRVCQLTHLPVLMKDVVVSREQIKAARKAGAAAVLIVLSALNRLKISPRELIDYAHQEGLEVLLEVHSTHELFQALNTEADLIGINNRDLTSLEVDLTTTRRILEALDTSVRDQRLFISESGIRTHEDIQYLRKFGVRGFLVGTSIMKADDFRAKLLELVRGPLHGQN